MANLFKAHIFKQRTQGEREEVKIKLFNLDGSPATFGGDSEPVVIEDWIDLTSFSNGWAAFDEGAPPQYRKRPDGIVEVRGMVVPGTTGTLFALPEGYRHNYGGQQFPCGAGTDGKVVVMSVSLTGNVSAPGPAADGTLLTEIDRVNLAAIRFSAD